MADRVPKKYVMLVGEISLVILSLVTALALSTDFLSAENAGSWWVLAVVAVFQGIIMGMMAPSRTNKGKVSSGAWTLIQPGPAWMCWLQ